MAHTRPSYDYISWAKGMGIQDFKSLNITKIKKQLSRTSQKELRDIKKWADSLWEEHLKKMLTETELQGDEKQVQKHLAILIRTDD